MKVRIVVCYEPRYRRGHRFDFVPPVTGIHLAAITPQDHEVEVFHQQVRPVPVDASPDLIALSFFSGFARAAYSIADRYRALGVRAVGEVRPPVRNASASDRCVRPRTDSSSIASLRKWVRLMSNDHAGSPP